MKKQLFYLLLAAGVLSACGPAAPQLGKDSVSAVKVQILSFKVKLSSKNILLSFYIEVRVTCYL